MTEFLKDTGSHKNHTNIFLKEKTNTVKHIWKLKRLHYLL